MIKLYGVPASRAMRCLWALEELSLPYENVPVHFMGGATRTEQMLALNPNGHIPVLDDDGFVLYESLAINMYLVQKHGGALLPATLQSQALCQQWNFWVVSECEKLALDCLLHTIGLPPDQRNQRALEQAIERLVKPLTVLDGHLAKHAYLLGEEFTIADLNLCSIVFWTKPVKTWPVEWPNLTRWTHACMQRPAFQKVRQLQKA